MPCEEQKTSTQVQCHMNMEAEMKVMHLHTKECQRLPADHQKLGERRGTASPTQPSEGTNPENTLMSDF